MEAERWFVAAMAMFTGVMFLRFAGAARRTPTPSDKLESIAGLSEYDRLQRADDAREHISAWPRYAIAFVSFGNSGALFVHIIQPTVGYAILCLLLAMRCVADLISEECAPRRHSAFLWRSRSVDPVLLIWIAIAFIASLSVAPSIIEGTNRGAAIVVTACAVMMLAVAWRIASAAPLLIGDDLAAAQAVDRETRVTRTGNTCFFTVAAAGAFNGFTGYAGTSFSAGSNRAVVLAMLIIAALLLLWKSIYVRRMSRMPLAL